MRCCHFPHLIVVNQHLPVLQALHSLSTDTGLCRKSAVRKQYVSESPCPPNGIYDVGCSGAFLLQRAEQAPQHDITLIACT